MFPAMRRWKQQLTQQACVELLKQEPRGVLSLMGEDGYPYGLPISYWYCEADGKIYFHGAKSGHKIDAIRRCDKASFCVYDQGFRREGEWGAEYQECHRLWPHPAGGGCAKNRGNLQKSLRQIQR